MCRPKLVQLFNEFVTSTLTDMCWVWTLVLRLKSTLLNQDTPCCFIFVVFFFFFQEHTRAPLPSLVLSGLSHTIVTVAGTCGYVQNICANASHTAALSANTYETCGCWCCGCQLLMQRLSLSSTNLTDCLTAV